MAALLFYAFEIVLFLIASCFLLGARFFLGAACFFLRTAAFLFRTACVFLRAAGLFGLFLTARACAATFFGLILCQNSTGGDEGGGQNSDGFDVHGQFP